MAEYAKLSETASPDIGAVKKPAFTRDSCMKLMMVNCILTPITTQSVMPIAPLLVVLELKESPVLFGNMLFVMTIGTVISFIAMTPLLMKFSPKAVFLGDFGLRILSGVLWYFPVLFPSHWEVPYLLMSRFIYGLTLNSFAIPATWVGVRLEREERPKWVAQFFGLILLGIVLGPLVGSMMMVVSPNDLLGYSSPGLLTIISSTIMFGLHYLYFDDEGSLVPEKKADEEATPDALLIAWLNCLANFTSGAAFLAGFEATISLQIFTAYGWGTRESWKAWGPFACSQLLFAVLISPVCIDKLNPNKVWIVCATLMTLSIALGVNWFDLSQPIPVWLFLLENVFANGMVLHNQLLQGLMTSQLPPAKQAKFQALNALAGQVGRAMGPLVATMVFNWAVHAEGAGNGSGANWSRIYMIAVGMPGQFLPALWFRRVYGNWEDKSPSEQKAAKDGVKELAA